VTMRSLSTSAFGQPSEMKLTLGAAVLDLTVVSLMGRWASCDQGQDQGIAPRSLGLTRHKNVMAGASPAMTLDT